MNEITKVQLDAGIAKLAMRVLSVIPLTIDKELIDVDELIQGLFVSETADEYRVKISNCLKFVEETIDKQTEQELKACGMKRVDGDYFTDEYFYDEE